MSVSRTGTVPVTRRLLTANLVRTAATLAGINRALMLMRLLAGLCSSPVAGRYAPHLAKHDVRPWNRRDVDEHRGAMRYTTPGYGRATSLGGGLLVAVIALLTLSVTAGPAAAHGGDESQEGYVLVQQALAHLAHDTSHVGVDLAMEKVDDALATQDQEGVAVADVEHAKRALEAGQVVQARALLQRSIKGALREQPPATGEQTGTTVVAPILPGRGGMTGLDWAFLIVSALLLLAGAGLAYRFRPADTLGELRRRLDTSPPAAVTVAGHHHPKGR